MNYECVNVVEILDFPESILEIPRIIIYLKLRQLHLSVIILLDFSENWSTGENRKLVFRVDRLDSAFGNEYATFKLFIFATVRCLTYLFKEFLCGYRVHAASITSGSLFMNPEVCFHISIILRVNPLTILLSKNLSFRSFTLFEYNCAHKLSRSAVFYLRRSFYQGGSYDDYWSLSFDRTHSDIHLDISWLIHLVDAFSGNYIRETWMNRNRECRDINCTGRY